MSGHIFISYRVVEADFTLKLAADLKNAGVNIWMDRFELKPGDDWPRGIEYGVDNCGSMITVLSPDYVASKNCMRELRRADRMNRPLFPVLLRPVDKSQYPYELEGIQYLDFRDWRDEKIYREKTNSLIDVIRQKAGGQIGALPDAETRYLTSLIAELEARKGVLEYVELSAQTDAPEDAPARPDPYRFDEWAAGFSELIDKPDAGARRASPLRDDQPKQKIALKSIAEAVEKHPRFVLIGDPGAGKTTTLRKLALDAARKRLDNPRSTPIPLLVYLPQWDDEPTPLDFVRNKWNEHFQIDPAGLLQMGDILLYLDGLNEMGGTGAAKAKLLNDWLQSSEAPARVIITCRAGDYSGGLQLGDTPTVQAEELSEDQIREFANNYLGDKAEAFLKRVLPDDEYERESARSLARLAQNPYMLSGLALIYEYSPEGDLPRNTGTLFQRLVRALWERERQKRTPGWIYYNEAEKVFSELAFAMIDKDTSIDVPLEYAMWFLKDDNLLFVSASANIINIQDNKVRFYHQLMLEYFAGVKLNRVGIIDKLLPAGLAMGRLTGKWDEVIVALCGIVPNIDNFLTDLMKIDPYLAAYCIHETPVYEQTKETLISILIDKLSNGNYNTRCAAAEALGVIGDESAIQPLLIALNDNAGFVRAAAVRSLEEIGNASVLGLLKALENNYSDVRFNAAEAITRIGTPEVLPTVVPFWKTQLYNLELIPGGWITNKRYCDIAAEALTRIGTPEALAAVEAWRRNQQGGDS